MTVLRSFRPGSATKYLVVGVGVAAAAGCIGRIGDPSGSGDNPGATAQAQCASAAPDTEPVLVRMLNRREYANTVRDLLGTTTDVTTDFPADVIVGFDNHADSLVASSDLVNEQLLAAETLAAAVDLASVAACSSGGGDSACADDFIKTFGRRAYRRPLEDAEAAVLRKIFDDAQTAGRTFDEALRLVLEGMLVAPQFLYRVETSATPDGGVVQADPYELASRLSYFLWASMPDEALLDAAQAGELADATALEKEIRRMLADPKAREMTAAFHDLWLELYQLDATTKDDTLYPDFATLQPLFRQETATFADWVFWSPDTQAKTFLLSDVGFMNDALAAHYGMTAPGSTSLEQVDTKDSERFGLLTQGSILSMFANPNRTSPTRRGKFVRDQLLCQPPPPPPPNVPPLDTSAPTGNTLRERLAEHTKNPACATCHQMLDPVGFGLENYDAVGAYRSMEGGAPVDASGELLGVHPNEGSFVGARELAELVASTDEYYACVATQWFRFAAGRNEGAHDACTITQIESGFRDAGDRMPELLVKIALSNAVLYKRTEKAQ